MFRRCLIAAALAAAVLAPAATASAPKLDLALLPLSKGSLGPAGHGLALAHDSGVVPDAVAAGNSLTGSAKAFEKLGRVTGYYLDYGDAFRGGAGVSSVETGVEEYRTAADAKRGLAFWRHDDAQIAKFRGGSLAVTASSPKPTRIGRARFAYLATLTVPGVAPVSLLDEQFAVGRYVLEVEVAAGRAGATKALATKLARRLDARLKLALAGRLHGKPVKLLPKLKKGPPAKGPKLAALALTPSDLGQATVADKGYAVDADALSAYSLDMAPAGSFDDLGQQIEWYPSATEATFLAGFGDAAFMVGLSSAFGSGVTVQATPVDVSGLGDDAAASIVELTPPSGSATYVAVVSLAKGKATDFVFAGSANAIAASAVQSLAQAAASRLDAGF